MAPSISFVVRGGGAQISTPVTLPAYIGIANTNTPLLLSKIDFRFENESVNGYKYDYLGDPVIEYSDDGVTWAAIPTVYSFGDNLNIQYYSASGPAPAYYRGGKTISISQYTHSTKHTYWRIVFQTASVAGTIPKIAIHITDIVWLDPATTTLFSGNTNFGESDIDTIQYAQSENVLYLVSGTNKQPMTITYNAGQFIVDDFNPEVGGAPIWPTHGGFPAAVAVFQNRLCFAGFNNFRGRVVMSEFGNFTNYTMPTPMTATAPITVDSLQLKSRIDFLWAGDKSLYGLSAEGVSMIDAAGGGISTDQIEFQLRNREPAAAILPTVKDDIMVYVGRNLQKIMITDFDFVVQRYRAVVLSVGYDSFLHAGVKAIHYIPTKARLIYGLLNDGKGFMLLFDQPLSKNSIYPYSIAGEMTDILPIKYKETTKLLAVSSYNGVWNMIQKDVQPEIELMDFMTEDEQKSYTSNFITSNIYLDYYGSYDSESEFDWVPMPDVYAEATTIDLVADGKYVGGLTTSIKELNVLTNSDETIEYFVEQIADGEPAWVKNSETGVWNCYGVLSISGGVMSVNSITVVDSGTTQEVVCCDLIEPAKSIVIGVPYESYAVIKFVTPYMIRKFPREIAVNFINTGYLELGNSFNDMRPVLGNIAETVTLDNMPILMNGNYEKTLDKQVFETPYVIVSSNKGLPFSITGIDYEVDYSNYQGGV